ncbi:hypothetical protein [Streptomyces chrestomyceticus]|uniref:Uncharacterized protein n=1 Tax=Streptomyces chrestomyceticus TaxID=68185 RepID=A0ABU7WT82_9ACTN
MEITGRVRQSSHPRQSTEQAQHARHIVLDAPLTGRLYRETGDALCRPAVDFYELERTDLEGDATCKKCVERAARYGIRVITTGAADTAEAEKIAASLTPKMREVLPAVVAAGAFRDNGLAALPYGVTYPSLQALIRRGLAEKYETDETRTDFTGEVITVHRYRATDKGLAVLDLITSATVEDTAGAEQDAVGEDARTAHGSTPSDAAHPAVIAAREALDGLDAATMTDHHDPSDPTEDERDVHGYLIEPRTPNGVRIHWLEDGSIGRFRLPNDAALDQLTDRLTKAGWTVKPRGFTCRVVVAERPTQQRVVEGVVVEHAGTAEGSTPADAAHPDVAAAREALKGLAAAMMTDHHDVNEPTEDEQRVRGYVVAPRGPGSVRVVWLEGGRAVRRGERPHGHALAGLADRFARRGWSVRPLLDSSPCVIAERPAEHGTTPAAPDDELLDNAEQTWRGAWIGAAPADDALFDLDPADAEQGALFAR